jgi:hypothetical protein
MAKFISIYIKYIVYKSQQAILSTHVVFPLAATVERVPSNTDNNKIKLQITVYSFYACIRASGIFRVVQITPPNDFQKTGPDDPITREKKPCFHSQAAVGPILETEGPSSISWLLLSTSAPTLRIASSPLDCCRPPPPRRSLNPRSCSLAGRCDLQPRRRSPPPPPVHRVTHTSTLAPPQGRVRASLAHPPPRPRPLTLRCRLCRLGELLPYLTLAHPRGVRSTTRSHHPSSPRASGYVQQHTSFSVQCSQTLLLASGSMHDRIIRNDFWLLTEAVNIAFPVAFIRGASPFEVPCFG